MPKKTLFTTLGVMLAVMIAAVTLVFTVGPMVSADEWVGTIQDRQHFWTAGGYYEGPLYPEFNENGNVILGLSWNGAEYACQYLEFNVIVPDDVTAVYGCWGDWDFGYSMFNVPYMWRYEDDGSGGDYTHSEKVTSVELPDNLKIIGDLAFYNCNRLTSLDLPTNLMMIGDYAFAGTKIATITIPASVTTVGEHIFGEIVDEEWYLQKIIVQTQALYDDPNLKEYKDAGILKLVEPSQNNNENNQNENQEPETPSLINEKNQAGVVAAVAGTTGGAAGLGTIATILGVVISKKRKNN